MGLLWLLTAAIVTAFVMGDATTNMAVPPKKKRDRNEQTRPTTPQPRRDTCGKTLEHLDRIERFVHEVRA